MKIGASVWVLTENDCRMYGVFKDKNTVKEFLAENSERAEGLRFTEWPICSSISDFDPKQQLFHIAMDRSGVIYAVFPVLPIKGIPVGLHLHRDAARFQPEFIMSGYVWAETQKQALETAEGRRGALISQHKWPESCS